MRPPAQPRLPRPGPTPHVPVQEERGRTTVTPPAPRQQPAREPVPTERARRWLPVRQRPEDSRPAGPGFLERLAERTRAQRRLAWRKVLLAVGVLVTVGALAWALLASPLLALDVEQVTVSGAGEGTTVPVEAVMDVVMRHEGVPLTRLDTAGLTEQVGAITTVRSVDVSRSWPRGLSVQVTARVPVAAATAEEGLVLLDVDGVVVGSVAEPPDGLPRVTVPLSGERAGQTLEAVLAVLAQLPAELRAEVATAGATNPASITLELTDGARVLWGDVAESELKAAVLAVVRERPAAVYDVTVPRSPTLSD
ncbi:FtsQ-type POTRA domain-containing protein [Georgenia wutianyii]|uniref:FtsQ-type POTRA domain-containing protein n=1 Tax=Georgenia wutianyii TaxID=2585135 RepID=A0ABX5VK93_9MICO|nr:cell division protein FtsQ/DivIB [Georgenia wutianyii]QDB78862.1 FtsQ-type POTRA domain-containing protein [Georgenia wutianyii]